MKQYLTNDDIFKSIEFRLDETVTVVMPEPKQDLLTGRMYDSLELTLRKCRCGCHRPGSNMIHFMPCCDRNGIVVEQKVNYCE